MRTVKLLLAGAMLALSAGLQAEDKPQQASLMAPASEFFTGNFMNIFRRFPADKTAEMVRFYDKALGLKPLSPIQLSATQQMILFGVGSGQIKLSAGLVEDRTYHIGSLNAATGIRVFTLFYSDEVALKAAFRENGYMEPVFIDAEEGFGEGTRAALVQDPGGFWLELVISADAKAGPDARTEVGINAYDLDASRAFYRDFVGLKELPPVRDPLLGVTKYPFRHGETTINLWSEGVALPRDTGSAGIQYVVRDVDTVAARGAARKVAVETPLNNLPGFALRTVWLNDGDGVTNYFAQVGARAPAPAPAPAN